MLDRIIMANDKPLTGKELNSDSIVNVLKGEIDSKVRLTVKREGEDKLLKFTVKRSNIPIKSVDAAYMLTDRLGYIKINRFAETTFKEFKKALEKLQDQGATQLALDLRDNPGGFLGIAEQIADEFLEGGKLILFTRDKKGNVENSIATRKGDFEDGEVYVMLNESSASASEVIAGALQDNDKGVIVGRRSYGKGLVQREMALGDGSAVRLTVSRYYTPTGRSIQRPYNGGGNRSYFNDYYKRLRNGELSNESFIEVADSLKFTTPKGKVVYGGGGIIPDVFVPIDKAIDNETIGYLSGRGHFGFFVFEELDKNREVYRDVSKEDFVDNFIISDDIVVRFQDYVNRREGTNITFVAYNEVIKLLIKANLGRQLFDDNTYYEIVNSKDLMVEEVLLLSKDSEKLRP
jgi:carboxyl-terminal processing protease